MVENILARVHLFDCRVVQRLFASNHRRLMTPMMVGLSRSANGYLYILLIAFLFLVDGELGLSAFSRAFIGFAIELPVYFILKRLIKRPRPFQRMKNIAFVIPPPDHFSFPSGHTAAAFLMAMILSAVFPGLLIPSLLWATAVGFSRVYVGVHYPTDIFAGMAMGLLIAVIPLWII